MSPEDNLLRRLSSGRKVLAYKRLRPRLQARLGPCGQNATIRFAFRPTSGNVFAAARRPKITRAAAVTDPRATGQPTLLAIR